MSKKKKIILLGFFILFIILFFVAAYFVFEKDEFRGVAFDESRREDPSYYYLDEYDENIKNQVSEEDISDEITYVKSLIEKGRWNEASDYLQTYFEKNSRYGEGEELYAYYKDITLILNIKDSSPSDYPNIFSSFSTDYTFLAAMVYYPASTKLSAFLNMQSIVPTTHSNDVVFFEPRDVDEYTLSQMAATFSNFGGGEVIDFSVDGIFCTATLYYDTDHHFLMWDLSTTDEKSYFMTVSDWKNLL